MDITAKIKLRATGPLISDGPQHCCLIILIEHISFENEEETPVFLLSTLLPQEANCMNETLYTRLHPPTHLTSIVCLL